MRRYAVHPVFLCTGTSSAPLLSVFCIFVAKWLDQRRRLRSQTRDRDEIKSFLTTLTSRFDPIILCFIKSVISSLLFEFHENSDSFLLFQNPKIPNLMMEIMRFRFIRR